MHKQRLKRPQRKVTKMKMIVRMFCAVALVVGALSLTGCGDKEPAKDAKAPATDVKAAAKDAAKDVKDAAKGAADAVKK